jgi:hypothetical protein
VSVGAKAMQHHLRDGTCPCDRMVLGVNFGSERLRLTWVSNRHRGEGWCRYERSPTEKRFRFLGVWRWVDGDMRKTGPGATGEGKG